MIILNYIVIALIAIAFIVLSTAFLLLITRNMKQGQNVRKHLAQRVESLRMSKMLRALGIDYSSYLYNGPLHIINDSMNKCEKCPTTDQCDEALGQGTINPDEIDFCPNQECLSGYSVVQKKDSHA